MLTTARGRGGAVTSPHFLASAAGLDVLREGGSAISQKLSPPMPFMCG